MKKFLSLVLSSALLISAMAGCGPSNADGSGSAASVESAVSSVSGGAEESAAAGEKPALTIGLRPNPLTTDYEDNYLTDLMEETAGVSLLPIGGGGGKTEIFHDGGWWRNAA